MRTLRRFVAPVIGWGMILIVLVAVAERIPRANTRSSSYISRCMAEARKTHHMADHQILAAFSQSSHGEGNVSFGFHEEKTGQLWNCQCTFDRSGNLSSILIDAK